VSVESLGDRMLLDGDALSTASLDSAGELREAIAAVSVGDEVVYGSYGVGRVVGWERKVVVGVERTCVVVDLAAGLRVTLPLEEAAKRLRAVASTTEVAQVRETLAQEPGDRDGSWTRQIKKSKAKLASGRAVDLAELVRDGARYEGGSSGARLSTSERRVYLQARRLLVREVASARGIEEVDAEAWIEAQIALPDERGLNGREEATADVREAQARAGAQGAAGAQAGATRRGSAGEGGRGRGAGSRPGRGDR
jgi:RNA polymerase-interacting CarD/CdnL/TRCF family regulator